MGGYGFKSRRGDDETKNESKSLETSDQHDIITTTKSKITKMIFSLIRFRDLMSLLQFFCLDKRRELFSFVILCFAR
jgi:hypothetical protein